MEKTFIKDEIKLLKQTPKRDATIDLIKGIAIIFMVMGHSLYAFMPVKNFVYLFHMAVFFIASGYCFNKRSVENFHALKKSFIKKVKTLWLPYAVCNFLFTILNNVFVKIAFYEGSRMLPIKVIIKDAVKKIFFLGGPSELAGATWFLMVLFFVSVFNLIVMFLKQKIRNKYGPKASNTYFAIVIVICCILSVCFNREILLLPTFIRGGTLEFIIKGVSTNYLLFCFGMLFRKLDFKKIRKEYLVLILITSSVSLCCAMNFYTSTVSIGQYYDELSFIAVNLFGWLFVWSLAELIPHCMASIIEYCGQKSLYIVILHFLMFKIPSLVYYVVNGDISVLHYQTPTNFNSIGIQIVYCVSGIVLSLFFGNIYNEIKNKTLKIKKEKL